MEDTESKRHTVPDLFAQARALVKEIEEHCPCGARPESPNIHPHVTGCPVLKLKSVLATDFLGILRATASVAWNNGYYEGVMDGAPYPSEQDVERCLGGIRVR